MRKFDGYVMGAKADGRSGNPAAAREKCSNQCAESQPTDEDRMSVLLERNRCLESQLFHLQRVTSLSRLLPGVVHDFNHLLTYIIGYTELSLTNLGPGDAIQGHLEKVRDAGKKANELTRKLLNHCSKQELQLEPVDMSTVVENVGRLFERILGENIRLEFDLEDTAGPVLADILQMEQILTNLVVNARDAMPAGGRITFRTRNVCLHEGNGLRIPGGNYAVIAVEDSGSGIPEDIRDKVFEPYFTTKKSSGGTGLGLSTVHSIVQDCAGHIILESTPEKGSRFSIYLPIAGSRFSIHSIAAPTRMMEPGAVRSLHSDNAGKSVLRDVQKACRSLL